MNRYRFHVDPAAQEKADTDRAILRAQHRRSMKAEYWRSAWADAQTGPLPFAFFLVSSWRRLTHKAHPSYLVLSALSAVQESLVQRLPDPDDYRALSTVQRVRLGALRWLIGDKDIEGEPSGPTDHLRAPSSTLLRTALEEAPASPPQLPIGMGLRRPIRPAGQSDLQAAAFPDRSAPLPVAVRSPAISSNSHSVPTRPPSGVCADDEQPNPADPAAHRLSETPK